MATKEGKSWTQTLREKGEASLTLFRPFYEASDNEEAFLDGDRYVHNADYHNRDRRRIQIRGREVDDTARHFLAKATSKPLSVEARPIDQEGDPDTAEHAVALVEQELFNPMKMFQQELQSCLLDARQIGCGMVWMDWCPREGAWGEMVYTAEDWRRYMWKWGYHPHHILCDWLVRKHRYDVEYARDIFKAPWLQPDREAARADRVSPGVPLLSGYRQDLVGLAADDEKVTLEEWWFKNDRTTKGAKETGSRTLKKGERYMACNAGCAYRSDTQDELKRQEKLREELPEMIQGCPGLDGQGCPQGGDLERVDTLGEEQPMLVYPKGRRLTIVSPYCSNGDDDPVYDGGWPVSRARSYPLLYITAYPKRGRPRGESDTSWCWDQQLAADHLRTQAIQATFEHRTYKLLPGDGITNTKGKRFEFRDDDQDVMIRDNSKMGPLDVQFLNSSGLDPAWNVAFQPVYQSLTQYRGMYDQGPVQDRSAKSGVALQTENAIGEIPVENFIQRKNFELGLFYGVVDDYIRATYPAARIARLNLGGVDIVVPAQVDTLSNYDYRIEETPDFTGLDKQKQEAFAGAKQEIAAAVEMGLDPVDALEVWAEFNSVPRGLLRKMQKLVAPIAQAMKQQKAQMEAEQRAMAEDQQMQQETQRGNQVEDATREQETKLMLEMMKQRTNQGRNGAATGAASRR